VPFKRLLIVVKLEVRFYTMKERGNGLLVAKVDVRPERHGTGVIHLSD
jgi:hypothetical protein